MVRLQKLWVMRFWAVGVLNDQTVGDNKSGGTLLGQMPLHQLVRAGN